jgi:hypothetical protein
MEAKTVELTDEKIEHFRAKMSEVMLAGRTEWCFGCGAGAKALRELLTTKPDFFREVISEETIIASAARVNIDDIKGITSWCFGCGAGAKAMPEVVGMPAAQLDKVIGEVIEILGA